MKKNYLFTIILILFALGVVAQPVITYSGNAPQIGDHIYTSAVPYGSSFDPGPAGGNQSWDFSDVQPIISMENIAIDPASTPNAADFPEATIAFSDPENLIFSYSQITSSALIHLGNDQGSGNVLPYTDSRKEMQYPFSYNDTYSDTYSFASLSSVMLIHESGTITATANAWGSVKTPAGTYNSTLRVKKVMVFTDSVWNTEGDLMNVTSDSFTSYEWYTATSHYFVLSIGVDSDGASSIAWTSSANGIKDNPLLSQINVFPIPADNIINVKIAEGKSEDMVIDLISSSGKELKPLTKTGNRQFSADISRLPSGIYFLRFKNGSGNIVAKEFIKH